LEDGISTLYAFSPKKLAILPNMPPLLSYYLDFFVSSEANNARLAIKPCMLSSLSFS